MPHAIDEHFAAMHAASWSIDDVRFFTATSVLWLVTGSRAGHVISAQGLTLSEEAWANAVELAEKVTR
jgi:hypothetical protein